MDGEFALIRQFFTRPTPRAVLGVGDDCALLQPAPGMHLAISSDMLVNGRHFFDDAEPQALGHKALAVNLSDLAACGAKPLAFTLALALPQADPLWLGPFSRGLFALADAHGCELIGGDTTRGPLNICITVFGEMPAGQALLRSGAQAGDDIYVSGALGEASLALAQLLHERDTASEAKKPQVPLAPEAYACALARLHQPTPRVALGQALRGVASAAADISDGLLADLGHILERSAVGATVHTACLPALPPAYGAAHPLPAQLLRHALAGGDDYELVFTAPPAQARAVQAAAQASHTPVTRIGHIDAQPGLRLLDGQGQAVTGEFGGFDHFA